MIDHSSRRSNWIFRSYARLSAIIGFASLIVSGVIFLVTPSLTFLIQLGASAGTALLLFAILRRPNTVHLILTGRSARYTSDIIVVCLAFGAILGIVNFLSLKNNFEFDLTETGEFTLSEQTLSVLKDLKEPVQIVAFFRTDDQRWLKSREYLERYSRYTDLITYRLHDPNTERTLARSYELEDYGLVFMSGVYDYEVSTVDEQAITTGLMCVTSHRHREEELQLVSFENSLPTDRHFSLNPFEVGLIFFITLIFIPLGAFAAGLRVWWIRQ